MIDTFAIQPDVVRWPKMRRRRLFRRCFRRRNADGWLRRRDGCFHLDCAFRLLGLLSRLFLLNWVVQRLLLCLDAFRLLFLAHFCWRCRIGAALNRSHFWWKNIYLIRDEHKFESFANCGVFPICTDHQLNHRDLNIIFLSQRTIWNQSGFNRGQEAHDLMGLEQRIGLLIIVQQHPYGSCGSSINFCTRIRLDIGL